LIVGLTGGIASGKSTALAMFESLEVPYVDADIVAREVVEPGSVALADITAHFGHAILQNNGELDRSALRQVIFADSDHKQWLENLLHPLIQQRMLTSLNNFEAPYVLLAAPLLFENNLDRFCDKTITLDVSEEVQLSRATLRDGSNIETLKSIMASQWSRQKRLDKADYILDNSGNDIDLSAQVTALHRVLLLQSQLTR
jgi:dephospho-CoA kinase